MKGISLVFPAYNEEKRLSKTLPEIVKFCNKNFSVYEIIIVDDGSRDGTAKIAKKFSKSKVVLVQNKKNMGKGYSVKQGILNAKYELVLFSDSDLATPLHEINKLLKYINEGYDVVIASRNLKDSNIITTQPKYRQLMGKTFAILTRLTMGFRFKDTQCGFKLFKTKLAKKIVKYQTLNRWAFDVELLYIAKKMKLKVKEVPVTWIDNRDSRLGVWKDTTRMLTDLFKIRINSALGKYR